MRWLVILSLVLLPSCAWRLGISNQGFAVAGELADVRIAQRSVQAGDVRLEKDAAAMSEDFAEMVETVLPELVQIGVRAALACSGLAAAGAAAGQACQLLDLPAPPEVPE